MEPHKNVELAMLSATNLVRVYDDHHGWHRTRHQPAEPQPEYAAVSTARRRMGLSKNGVEQVRACQGGFITATIDTQFTGASAASSLISDHYVDMQFFDDENQSYVDYTGYRFLPGYSYPTDWLFYPANIFGYHYPVSIHLGSTTVSCICGCTTRPSDSEWSNLSSLWPHLARCQVCKLAPATPTYNCMAWTLDDTTQWWWLQADSDGNGKVSVSELNAFYSSKGKSNIAYYGFSAAEVKHVAKKSGGLGVDCQVSSKLGALMRMAHDMTQLEGGTYGNIVGGN